MVTPRARASSMDMSTSLRESTTAQSFFPREYQELCEIFSVKICLRSVEHLPGVQYQRSLVFTAIPLSPPQRSGCRKRDTGHFIRTPIPRSSSVPGTKESQRAAQIPATAMGVFRIPHAIPPRICTIWPLAGFMKSS